MCTPLQAAHVPPTYAWLQCRPLYTHSLNCCHSRGYHSTVTVVAWYCAASPGICQDSFLTGTNCHLLVQKERDLMVKDISRGEGNYYFWNIISTDIKLNIYRHTLTPTYISSASSEAETMAALAYISDDRWQEDSKISTPLIWSLLYNYIILHSYCRVDNWRVWLPEICFPEGSQPLHHQSHWRGEIPLSPHSNSNFGGIPDGVWGIIRPMTHSDSYIYVRST